MSLKTTALGLALAAFLLPACNPGSKKEEERRPPMASAPAWVYSQRNLPGYPDARYLMGIGSTQVEGDVAKAREVATQLGRANISSQLKTTLESETQNYFRQVAVDGEVTSVDEFTQAISAETGGLLYGAKVVSEWQDQANDTLYLLVAMDREVHAQSTLKGLDQELAKVSGSAAQSTAGGKLRSLIEENAILEGLVDEVILLGVVLPGGHPLRPQFEERYARIVQRTKAVRTELRDMGLTVTVASGGGQEGYPAEDLASEIVFEARSNGKPLAGFPVAFALEYPGKGEIAGASSQTDSKGRFRCRVVGLRLTGDQENGIIGSLDFASLGSENLEAPADQATFTLPTVESSVFAVAIEERNFDSVVEISAVAGDLEGALQSRGIQLRGLDQFLSAADQAKAATASGPWLQEKLAGKIDYLVRGTARSAQGSGTGVAGVESAYAGCDLELFDIRSGKKVAVFERPPSQRIKGISGTQLNAGTAALKKLSEQSTGALMAEIDRIFSL